MPTWSPASPILRMRLVPLIDVSGMRALCQMIERCRRNGTRVILSGLRRQPSEILAQRGLQPQGRALLFAGNFAEAIQLATTRPDANAGSIETL